MTFTTTFRRAATCMAFAACASAWAQTAAPVDVQDAWVRAAVPGQSGTGAFMKLTAHEGLKLVGASTPAAGVAEVHEMKMEGDTMRMRGVSSVELPAHRTVELKPGGYHLMLMDLKQPIVKDATLPLTLQFEDAKGAKSSLALNVPVRSVAPGAATGAAAPAHRH
ncbi:copper chaperone PCu(A)C [Variovorax boronicumulans]|uniref:copper chaperone PCu(A)C n=1 Tax=Variovorax boronicumulans TaxID=436515 RepID=UPI001C571339